MADNNERSRASELFALLNEVHNEDNSADNGLKPVTEEAHSVDELLDILSQNSEEEPQDNGFGEEIPVSIFSHLSEEGAEANEPESAGIKGIHVSNVGSHFTDEAVPTPPLPESDTTDGEEEEEEEEQVTAGARVLQFLRGSSFIPKACIYILVVCLVSVYLAYFAISVGNDIFSLVTEYREITVVIPENATDKEVAKILKENGIIEYDWVYTMYMGYRGDGDEKTVYLPGEHTLSTDMNYSQIIYRLTHGENVREIKRVTIPEGYTVNQIRDLLVSEGIGERRDYVEAINNYPYKWDFVKQLTELGYSQHRTYRLEGYLFPDTYDFYTDEDEVYVINKMLGAFNDKFWKDFVKVDKNGFSYQNQFIEEYGLTFDDAITLASIIQAEGGTARDFYYVSYVFHNRIKHKTDFPKLESDATIQYVLPERVSSSELDTSLDTPYNTYLYDGLTPGAISNPGLEALSAVLFPEQPEDPDSDPDDIEYIDAYYFVSNDAGKTYYAHSLRAHEKNKEKVKQENEEIKAGTYEG